CSSDLLDFGTQTFNVYVQGFCVAHITWPPYSIDELTACHHAPGIAQQHFQQVKFFQWHGDICGVDGDHMSFDVHSYWAGGNRIWREFFSLSITSQHCSNSGDEFSGRIWFSYVIVGAKFESNNFIDFAILGCEHDHRNLGILPDLANYIGTWLTR